MSVADGDTIRVTGAGFTDERLRLIGINTPEAGECYSEEATQALNRMLAGGEVHLVRDVSDRDQFGRLLRYVYLPDGTFVNRRMVRRGFAIARDYPPDSAKSGAMAAAQVHAEAAGAGLWSPTACGETAGEDVVIVHVEYDAPGDDNDNLLAEWVDIENRGGPAVLTSWVLADESATHRFAFPRGFVLGQDAAVRVRTGCGPDDDATLHWCSAGAVWNNDGDTAFLLDPNGNIHHRLGY